MENCVLQCETTGVIVRSLSRLTMNMCDLYGSKGAGVEIYPGSVCHLVGNGIHHCKDGILIKDFADELDVMPSITLENNVIHNNEGYGVIVVKPNKGENAVPLDTSEEDPVEPTPAVDGERGGDFNPTFQHESIENSSTNGAAASTSGRKWQFSRQLSRNKEISCSRPVQDLMDHQIFVSIQGNQFRRNSMGDFGTFFY